MKRFKEFLPEIKTATYTITKDGLGKKTYKIKISGAPGFELTDLNSPKWYAKELLRNDVKSIKVKGFTLKGDKKKIEKILSNVPNLPVEWI